jgi:hypothetical protein
MKKIGIVIHANAMLFSNGITQNAYFLYQCLTHCGYSCQFLCHESNPAPFQHEKIPLQQIVCNNPLLFNPDDFCLIVVVTRSITEEQYNMFHANRIRVVGMVCGNHFMQDQEDFIHGSNAMFSGKSDNIDELWTIPCYTHSHIYLETIRKVPVFSIPHLWNPNILQQRAAALSKVSADALIYDMCKHTENKIDIVIMEPNIALFKNAWMPIVACEYLHMKYPELINNVFVFNYPDNAYAHSMIQTFSLGSKLRPFKRLEMDEILTFFNTQRTIPIFLSHQTNNALNYLYYELLYFGYPLVHNSELLDGCGYMYDANNIVMCADAILQAYKLHNKHVKQYRDKALKYLERVDPLHPTVCKLWNEKIKTVLGGSS